MNEGLIKWLRWIAVLPAFVVTYVVGKLLYEYSLGRTGFFSEALESPDEHYILSSAYTVFQETAAITLSFLAASHTAPSHKKQTFNTLLYVLSVISIISVIALIWLWYVQTEPVLGRMIRSSAQVASWVFITIALFVSKKDFFKELE